MSVVGESLPSVTELELKFHVPAHVLGSLGAELRRRGARRTRLQARYFDTPGADLAAGGLALRLRREGRRWVQTLKAAADTSVRRLEHEAEVASARAAALPALDIERHGGSEAGLRLRDVLAAAGGRDALVEVYRTDVSRLRCDLKLRGALIEAALDTGTIRAGGRVATLCELELELKSGAPTALIELAKGWVAHGGLWLDTVSKAERGARLLRGADFGEPVKAASPGLNAGMPGAVALRAVLRSCTEQVSRNASEVAAGSAEEEHIHQLRIGLRRTRTALRELAALDARLDPRWEVPLSGVFRCLGEVRDKQTLARSARRLLEPAGAPLVTWSTHAAAVDAGRLVRAAGFQRAQLDLLGFVLREETTTRDVTPKHVRRHAVRRLARLHRRVVDAGRRFERLPPARQHQVRKRLKRLRYLAEFVAGLFDAEAVSGYLDRLEAAQDALGSHNDVVVARGKFRQEAEHDRRALFAANWLDEHSRTTALQCRRCLESLAEAPRFWRGKVARTKAGPSMP